MRRLLLTFCFSLFPLSLLAAPPKIANNVGFVVPLDSGEQGSALVITQQPDKQLLIIASPGSPPLLGLFDIIPTKLDPIPNPDPNPNPNPNPDPNPNPNPIPSGPYSLLWIEESAERDANRAAAIINADIRLALRDAGWTLRIIDKDITDENGKTPTELAPYIDAAKKDGLPRLFILDKAGVEVYVGAAPKNVDDFKTILKKFGLSFKDSKIIDTTVKIEGYITNIDDDVNNTEVEDKPNNNITETTNTRMDDTKSTKKVNNNSNCPTGTCPNTTRYLYYRWR